MQRRGLSDARSDRRTGRRRKYKAVILLLVICMVVAAALLYLKLDREMKVEKTEVLEYSTVSLPRRDIQATLVLTGNVAVLPSQGTASEFVYVAELENTQSDQLITRSALEGVEIDLKMTGAERSRKCARTEILNLAPNDAATDFTKPAVVKCYLDDKSRDTATRSAQLNLKASGLSKPLVIDSVLHREDGPSESFHGIELDLDAPQLQRVKMLAGDKEMFNASIQISGVNEPENCLGEINNRQEITDDVVATFTCVLPEISTIVTNLEVHATIELQTSSSALVAPKNTVRFINSDLGVVTVLDSRGKPQEKQVVLGLEDSLGIEILDGLQESELLIDLNEL